MGFCLAIMIPIVVTGVSLFPPVNSIKVIIKIKKIKIEEISVR